MRISDWSSDVCSSDLPVSTGPGRPKLGVTAREITLLPRHWEWLAQQRGGASATLRRLVQEAIVREEHGPRPARDALYRIMSPLAGDRPGFEEASRALFAGDRAKFEDHIAPCPADLARSVRRQSASGLDDAAPAGPIGTASCGERACQCGETPG